MFTPMLSALSYGRRFRISHSPTTGWSVPPLPRCRKYTTRGPRCQAINKDFFALTGPCMRPIIADREGRLDRTGPDHGL